MNPANIIISTHANRMGDIIMSLPMAAVLKECFPNVAVGIIGTEYTRPLIEACANADVYINKDDFLSRDVILNGQKPECIIHVKADKNIAQRARQLKIKCRIGELSNRQHWFTCNQFVRQSRKNSPLHEAQLNLALLQPLGIDKKISIPDMANLFGLQKLTALPEKFARLLDTDKFKLILHPKSRGSGREWGLAHFAALIDMLDSNKFQIFISGTENEKPAIECLLNKVSNPVIDISGLMAVSDFMAFVAACDGLVASSTGPIHLAAALQKHALGLYPPLNSINPQRWQPIGTKARFFVVDKACGDCRQDDDTCLCMQSIQPREIKNALDLLY